MSRNFCSLGLQTALGAELEACANPQRSHPQRAGRNPQRPGEPVTVLDLVAFLAIVVAQNELAMSGRQLAQTPTETLHTAISIAVRLVQHDVRLWRLVQGPGLSGAITAHLEQKHSRDANAIGGQVADDLSVANPPRATVDGLVRVFLGCRAAAPFEEADKVATNLEIAVGRDVAIGSKQRQQAVEGLLREGPLLTSHTSKGIYRHSPWSVNAAQ